MRIYGISCKCGADEDAIESKRSDQRLLCMKFFLLHCPIIAPCALAKHVNSSTRHIPVFLVIHCLEPI